MRLYPILFVVIISIRLIYLFIIPLGQFPDETFHAQRIRYESRPSPLSHVELVNNELHQPPLFYFISTHLIRNNTEFHFWYVLRIMNFCFSLLFTYLSWKILERLVSSKYIRLSVFSLINLVPTFTSEAVSISNDVLSYLMCAFFCFVFLSSYPKKITSQRIIFLGIISGVSLLVKTYAFPLIVSVIITFLIQKRRATDIVLFLLPAILIGMVWPISDYIKTSDFIFSQRMFQNSILHFTKPFAFPGYIMSLNRQTFETYISTYGSTNNIRLPSFVYTFLLSIFFISLWGLYTIRSRIKKMKSFQFFIIFLVCNIIFFLYLNVRITYQPQGRFLFPTLIPLSILFTYGLSAFTVGKEKYLFFIIFISMVLLNVWGLQCVSKYFYNLNFMPHMFTCYFYPSL